MSPRKTKTKPNTEPKTKSKNKITDFFICPNCNGSLTENKSELTCQDCATKYPVVGTAPWLQKGVEATQIQWKARMLEMLSSQNNDLLRYELAGKNKSLGKAQRERIKQVLAAKKNNIKSLESLLAPLAKWNLDQDLTKILGDKVQKNQVMAGYYRNILRDWSWGNKENKLAVELVKNVSGDLKNSGPMAVLGSGASRLAFDLHQHWKPEVTFCVDINPLLMRVAESLIKENSQVKLYEFPVAPRSKEDFAVEQTLKPPADLGEFSNFHFVYSDATDLSVLNESFDTVVTPWFLDIVQTNLESLMRNINRVLRSGGKWIQFGSLAFSDSKLENQYAFEDLEDLVKTYGFTDYKVHREEIPYLQSPHSAYSRQELVTTFSVTKATHIDVVDQPNQILPDWLMDLSKKIPSLPNFQQEAFRSQVYFEVLGSLNGEQSVDTLTPLLAQRYKMSEDQARQTLVSLLLEIVEK